MTYPDSGLHYPITDRTSRSRWIPFDYQRLVLMSLASSRSQRKKIGHARGLTQKCKRPHSIRRGLVPRTSQDPRTKHVIYQGRKKTTGATPFATSSGETCGLGIRRTCDTHNRLMYQVRFKSVSRISALHAWIRVTTMVRYCGENGYGLTCSLQNSRVASSRKLK